MPIRAMTSIAKVSRELFKLEHPQHLLDQNPPQAFWAPLIQSNTSSSVSISFAFGRFVFGTRP